MILAYAGRRASDSCDAELPPSALEPLAARLERMLGALAPRLVVGSAAAGTDLLVLEAAIARSIPAVALVAPSRAAFRATSVDDVGGDWAERFDLTLVDELVEVVEVDLEPPGLEHYLRINELILDAAENRRRNSEALLVLGVFSVARARGDVSAQFVAEAHARRAPVVVLAPRDGAVRFRSQGRDLSGVVGVDAVGDQPPDVLSRLVKACDVSGEAVRPPSTS